MRSTARTVMGTMGLALLAACVGDGGRGPGSNITGIGPVSAGSQEGTDGTEEGTSDDGESPSSTSAADTGGSADGESADGPKFDLGVPPDGGGPPPSCEELGNCECTIPEHVPCDNGTNDPFRAIGL